MNKRILTLLPVFFAAALVAGGVAWAGGTTNLSSLRVGTAGSGGVTFFNGSIVNESGPVTIADDLRVDGAISRLDGTADKPVKVNDDLEVSGDVTADNLYAASELYTQSETDSLLDDKADSGTSYTKAESEARYVSDSSPSWDPQTSYTSVYAAAFTPDGGGNAPSLSSDLVAADTLLAPIQLPHGAVVTGVSVIGLDNNAAENADVYGYLERLSNTASALSFDVLGFARTSTESANYQVVTDSSIDSATIDNSAYTYRLKAYMPSTTDLALRGMRVTYTTANPY